MAQGKAVKICAAKTRAGAPCEKPAGWGTPHTGRGRCRFHGGSTPNQIKHERGEEAKDAVVKYGLPRDVDPHTALIEELHRTAGWVAFLSQQIESFTNATDLRAFKGGGGDGIPEGVPDLWVQMLSTERTHLIKVAKTCVDVGIEERRVQIAEQQGELMAQVIRGLLADLKVAVTPEVQGIVRKHLTLVSSAA